MMSGLPAFGMNVTKFFDPLMYLTVLSNCLHDFLLGFLSLLHIHLVVACKAVYASSCRGSCTQLTCTAQDVHRDRHLQVLSVSRAWDSSMDDSPSASSSTQKSQFLHPHSFFVDDSQSSHMLKRISHSNDGRVFQNDYPFEVCKHLHHSLSRSCHVPVIHMQVQSSCKIT